MSKTHRRELLKAGMTFAALPGAMLVAGCSGGDEPEAVRLRGVSRVVRGLQHSVTDTLTPPPFTTAGTRSSQGKQGIWKHSLFSSWPR